jgi:putative SOS response-associated peptidase YedK
MPAGEHSCPERLRLGGKVSDSINRVYRLKEQYDAARALKNLPHSLHDLLISLQAARADELAAERAYREHVEQHRCLNA